MRLEIKKYGCYYFALVWLGWWRTNLSVSADLLNEGLYLLLQKKGWMDENCFIKRPDKILQWMGVDVTGVRKEPSNYRPKPNELCIGQWKHEHDMSHFVVMRDGCVVYDPWFSKEGGSKSVREGRLISYRIFPER